MSEQKRLCFPLKEGRHLYEPENEKLSQKRLMPHKQLLQDSNTNNTLDGEHSGEKKRRIGRGAFTTRRTEDVQGKKPSNPHPQSTHQQTTT